MLLTLSQDTDILTLIIDAELISLVVKELEKLPQQQASIFRLIYLEGLTTLEICDRLSTTSSNVYFAKSKATATLRKVFEHKDYKLYSLFFGTLLSSI